jgi:hypothetical protein
MRLVLLTAEPLGATGIATAGLCQSAARLPHTCKLRLVVLQVINNSVFYSRYHLRLVSLQQSHTIAQSYPQGLHTYLPQTRKYD